MRGCARPIPYQGAGAMPRKRNDHRVFLESPNSGTDSYVAVRGTTLKIADCHETVSLEFGRGRWEGRTTKQAIAKVEKLRWALDILEQNILKDQED